jgi:thiol-disulfide isomerase/thioredoxin
MRRSPLILLVALLALPLAANAGDKDQKANEEKLTIGAAVPAFSMTGTDGKAHTLQDYAKDSKATVVVFTCNTCPFSIAYEPILIDMAKHYEDQDVQFVLINSNDPVVKPGDSFDAMVARSKACKGLYKSILNAARCAAWNAEGGNRQFFLSGEDLTCQAGLAVQQDLALVSLIGIGHVERNGHHYVRGMTGAPAFEQSAFLRAHPDLYGVVAGTACLRIADGRLTLGSLDCRGFAASAAPDFTDMRPVPLAPALQSVAGD